MKNTLPLFGAALLALAALSAPALARDRHSTITGPKGKTATHDVSRARGDVSSSSTRPNGKTTSRVVNREKGQTTAVSTGPNGQTVTRETTRQP